MLTKLFVFSNTLLITLFQKLFQYIFEDILIHICNINFITIILDNHEFPLDVTEFTTYKLSYCHGKRLTEINNDYYHAML